MKSVKAKEFFYFWTKSLYNAGNLLRLMPVYITDILREKIYVPVIVLWFMCTFC